jgi:hypothetical protein
MQTKQHWDSTLPSHNGRPQDNDNKHQWEPYTPLVGMQTSAATMEIRKEAPQKTKKRTTR